MGVGQKQTRRGAALVLRRSTDRQDTSIDDQRTECVKYCQRNGIEVVSEYVDDAVSGVDTHARVALRRLFRDARSETRAFDYVVAYDASRFSREEIFDAVHKLQSLRELGIEVRFVKDDLDFDDPTGQLMHVVQQMHSNQVVKDASKSTLRGQAARAREGNWCGGPVPYGYDLIYVNRQNSQPRCRIRTIRQARRGSKRFGGRKITSLHEEYSPEGKFIRQIEGSTESYASLKMAIEYSKLVKGDPRRVATVRRIFDLLVNEGYGYRAIAKELNAEGIAPPSGIGLWCLAAVKAILNNPIYKGLFRWNYRAEGKYYSLRGGTATPRASRLLKNPFLETSFRPRVPMRA